MRPKPKLTVELRPLPDGSIALFMRRPGTPLGQLPNQQAPSFSSAAPHGVPTIPTQDHEHRWQTGAVRYCDCGAIL